MPATSDARDEDRPDGAGGPIDGRPGRRTFLDAGLERCLERDGYVVVPSIAADLLDHLRMAAALAVGSSSTEPVPPGSPATDWSRATAPGPSMRINIDDEDAAGRAAFEQALAPLWERLLPRLFHDHELLLSACLIKFPGADGVMPLHQDGTVVDEDRSRSVTVWLPVDDTGVHTRNGALHVLPGSHRVGRELRGTGTSQSFAADLPVLWRRSVGLDVRAGDAVVLDARVLHGSPPNRSDRRRVAVTGVVVPRGEAIVHVRADGGDWVQVLAADVSFYRGWSPRRAITQRSPDLAVVARVRNDQRVVVPQLLRGARRRRAVATMRHRWVHAGGSRPWLRVTLPGKRDDGPLELE